jgi:transcription antitermination factor NusG
MPWYGLHVRSSSESLVALKLERASIPSFYPFLLVKSRDGRRLIERKFIPGYVFAEFSLAADTPVLAIGQVLAICGAGRHALEIPAAQIAAVRQLVNLPETVRQAWHGAAGDRVRVTFGPFTGYQGTVIRWKKRAWVMVTLEGLQRSFPAEVDPLSLEPVRSETA